MRQIGTDFYFDPYEALKVGAMPTQEVKKEEASWIKNQVASKQHQYCSSQCVDFKSAGGIT